MRQNYRGKLLSDPLFLLIQNSAGIERPEPVMPPLLTRRVVHLEIRIHDWAFHGHSQKRTLQMLASVNIGPPRASLGRYDINCLRGNLGTLFPATRPLALTRSIPK